MKYPHLTLLFADDEPAVRKLYDKSFSPDGFKILLCEDAHQVVEKLKKEKIDLMVLDLQMPGMDQMDIFAMLKKEYPNIPLLIVSGHFAGLVDDFAAKGYTTTTFFNKPVSLVALKKSVFEILGIDALGAHLTDEKLG